MHYICILEQQLSGILFTGQKVLPYLGGAGEGPEPQKLTQPCLPLASLLQPLPTQPKQADAVLEFGQASSLGFQQ